MALALHEVRMRRYAGSLLVTVVALSLVNFMAVNLRNGKPVIPEMSLLECLGAYYFPSHPENGWYFSSLACGVDSL